MDSADLPAPLLDATFDQLRTLMLVHATGVFAVAYRPDGKAVATAGKDGLVRLWEIGTGVEVQRGLGHLGWVRGVAFTPKGDTLVTVGKLGQYPEFRRLLAEGPIGPG